MNKPEELVFSDKASFNLASLAKGGALIYLAVLIVGFGIALVIADVALIELALPCAATSFIWFLWAGILGVAARIRRVGEELAIEKMFEGEIWEIWQFCSPEWRKLVDAECDLISPKEEGLKAYLGAAYSAIVGAIIAAVLIVVGIYAIEDADAKTAVWLSAAAAFIVLSGAGLFQPMVARYESRRYRNKARRVPEPRVWFAPDGIYHETLGYVSLEDLEKVTDQTKSRKSIQFTLTYSVDTSSSSVAYPVPVPTGCEERAGRLVRRYRQERLST